MSLTKFAINFFRNIQTLELAPAEDFNLVLGPNGSGKTSILEAIHFLSLARSFRTRNHHKVISFDKPYLTVFAELGSKETLGVQKYRNGEAKIRINNEDITSSAQLASILPVSVLNADCYQLLQGSAQQRRQFLDWGVFHFEPTFLSAWKQTQHVLRQRNAGLQQRLPVSQIRLWDELLAQHAELLHQQRLKYLEQFLPLVQTLIGSLFQIDIHCHYQRGWAADTNYKEVLQANWERDFAVGYTQFGAQRADLQWRAQDRLAKDVLSRGQQKLLIVAMSLAQGILLYQHKTQRCVYLIDDLASELDEYNCERVMQLLKSINAQVFITGVDAKGLAAVSEGAKNKVFYMESGAVK